MPVATTALAHVRADWSFAEKVRGQKNAVVAGEAAQTTTAEEDKAPPVGAEEKPRRDSSGSERRPSAPKWVRKAAAAKSTDIPMQTPKCQRPQRPPSPEVRKPLVTPTRSVECRQCWVTPAGGSWAAKVKGGESPEPPPAPTASQEPPAVVQPPPPASGLEVAAAPEALQIPAVVEAEIEAEMEAAPHVEAPAQPEAVPAVKRTPPVNAWRRRQQERAHLEAPRTPEPQAHSQSPAEAKTGGGAEAMDISPMDAPRAAHSLCWADKIRGADRPREGQTLADRARTSPHITFQGHQFPQPGWTPSPYVGAAKRGHPATSTPADPKRSRMCDSPMHSPSMKLQFNEGEGEVVPLEADTAALWIGSLKIRVNNDRWLCEHFGPYSLTRVLERGDGFAILQFPKAFISRVIQVFEGYRVDGRKMVVRVSNKYVAAPEVSA